MTFSDCEDAEELLELTKAALIESVRPKVSYELDAVSPSGTEVVAAYELEDVRIEHVYDIPWLKHDADITAVRIDESYGLADSYPVDFWFYAVGYATSITGLSNIKGVTSMRHTFQSMNGLTEIDLRGFTSQVTDWTSTFEYCTKLQTILVDEGWEPPEGATGERTFEDSVSLVGGNGTAYDDGHTGVEYLRIDADGAPGYLTAG